MRGAVRTGMIPILNSMVAAGLISIPGMMTGQILAGQNPASAARYQMFILFSIAAGVALVYGAMVWGVLPGQPGVSWEAHLFGALAGVVAAMTLRAPLGQVSR